MVDMVGPPIKTVHEMALIGAVLSWIGSTSILFICQYDQLRNQQSVPEVDAE